MSSEIFNFSIEKNDNLIVDNNTIKYSSNISEQDFEIFRQYGMEPYEKQTQFYLSDFKQGFYKKIIIDNINSNNILTNLPGPVMTDFVDSFSWKTWKMIEEYLDKNEHNIIITNGIICSSFKDLSICESVKNNKHHSSDIYFVSTLNDGSIKIILDPHQRYNDNYIISFKLEKPIIITIDYKSEIKENQLTCYINSNINMLEQKISPSKLILPTTQEEYDKYYKSTIRQNKFDKI